MRPITTVLLPGAFALVVASLTASPALAQSCRADVSELAAQIEEPQLQSKVDQPLDDIISEAGGLKAAIDQWEQKLADAQARRAELAGSDATALIRALDELVLILDQQLGGLQCRAE